MTTQAADFISRHTDIYEERARELLRYWGDLDSVKADLQSMQADGLLLPEEVRAIRWCVERISEVADLLESLAEGFAEYKALEMLKYLKGQLSAPLSCHALPWWDGRAGWDWELQSADYYLLTMYNVRFDEEWDEVYLVCQETGVRLEISRHLSKLAGMAHCLPEHWNWAGGMDTSLDGEGLPEEPYPGEGRRPRRATRYGRRGPKNPRPSSPRGLRRAQHRSSL